MCLVDRAQVDRDETRLPVVRVDDGRCRDPSAGEFERGAGEERKSSGVVDVIVAADAVERVSIEEVGTVDEQCARAVRERGLVESRLARKAGDTDRKRFDEGSGI